MLKVGDSLPDLKSRNQDGATISSENFKGKKLVILFYPKANTPGCIAEACDINDNLQELKKAGFEILGVSADPVEKQKKFHEKFSFKYDLLSDEDHDILEKFGVWQLKKFMGKEFMGIVRTTFIFDEKGTCARVIDKVKTKEAAAQILE